MRKIFIPLMAVVVVVSIIFAGCMPGAAPPVTPPVTPPAKPLTAADVPELQEFIAKGQLDPDLLMNPYKDLAIKPDGTPFQVAIVTAEVGQDWTADTTGYTASKLEGAGAQTMTVIASPAWNPESQISQLEDVIAAEIYDFLMILPAEEHMVASTVDKAIDAGMPAYSWCTWVASEKYTVPFVGYDFAGLGGHGENCAGEWYRDLAQELQEEIYILELWGPYHMQTAIERHEGFTMGLDLPNNPLLKVMKSEDTGFQTEKIMNATVNAFTAYPELNAVWAHGGMGAAPIEGLRAANRLFPVGDPNHVYALVHDYDAAALAFFEDELIDGFETIEPWRVCDQLVKVALLNAVLGKPVPARLNPPLVVLDESNIYTGMKWGAAWCLYLYMPDDYSLWPVLDTTEDVFDGTAPYALIPGGIPAPTKEMRMELLGY